MKILLTGSEGFIGSYVYDRLVAGGHQVIGLDCLDAKVHGLYPKPQRTHLVKEYGNIIYSDVRDVDVVIHLAAQIGVADSMEHPHLYHEHNTAQMYAFLSGLSAVARNGRGPRRLVVASSSSVYGNVPLPFHEMGPVAPNNVYGLTKYDQERLALMWGRTHNRSVVALRFFNVYGPGQAMDNPITGVMANFTKAILKGERPRVTQDGKQRRDFVHVSDVADVVCWAATTSKRPQSVLNVCTGTGTSMERATRLLAKALGRPDLTPNITGEYRDGDQNEVVGDPMWLAFSRTWEPLTLEVGIKGYGIYTSRDSSR